MSGFHRDGSRLRMALPRWDFMGRRVVGLEEGRSRFFYAIPMAENVCRLLVLDYSSRLGCAWQLGLRRVRRQSNRIYPRIECGPKCVIQ